MSFVSSGNVILPYTPAIFDLLKRTLIDEEKTESLVKLSVGLLGDLADTFRGGELREALMQDWVVNSFKFKGRGYQNDTKRTLKWAKEVSRSTLSVEHHLTP